MEESVANPGAFVTPPLHTNNIDVLLYQRWKICFLGFFGFKNKKNLEGSNFWFYVFLVFIFWYFLLELCGY